MVSVASGQIHRDDNKKQRAGMSIGKKKNLFKLEAVEYTAKNIGFKYLGEMHVYSFLDMGIWAKKFLL